MKTFILTFQVKGVSGMSKSEVSAACHASARLMVEGQYGGKDKCRIVTCNEKK